MDGGTDGGMDGRTDGTRAAVLGESEAHIVKHDIFKEIAARY